MNRPSFHSIDLWADCERSILQVFSESLILLSDFSDAAKHENEITVDLYKAILEVRFGRQKNTLADNGAVAIQTQNQPVHALGVAENDVSLRKKPDMLWMFYDENADVPEKSQRYFAIECKRLYNDRTATEYVKEGILRFVLDEWGYGRYEKSSAMIGYIKSGDMDSHLVKVNENNQKYCLPMIMENPGITDSDAVKQFVQDFDDREFSPAHFTLFHLWAYIGREPKDKVGT